MQETTVHTHTNARQRSASPRARPWLMLGIGVAAQASGTLVVTIPALLIPLFCAKLGLNLAQAGLLAAIPTLGMVLTLVAWGAVTDRYGERRTPVNFSRHPR